MKHVMFLFLLAVLMVPLFASRTGAVDFQKERSISETPGTGDFSVSVTMLGETEGVYRPGKEIRLSFQTTKDAYVVVYNIDADGYVQLLYPEDGRPVLSNARTTYFLPPPGRNLVWEAGQTTGVEYIHVLAVTEPGRLNEDELYFLSRGDRLPEEKRLRIDTDPYIAFNTIDEEIVRDAESDPPATDDAHFYINRRVDYPRYLCAKCHSPEKISDPYAMECPEIVIEEIAYEDAPRYPYPPLYDVRHAGEPTGEEDYTSDSYAEKWLDENEETNDADETHYRLSISYSTYNPYAPYFGPTLLFYDPFYWDPFWWGFGWSWTWGYGFWSTGWWYPPYYSWAYHYRYPWWGWNDDWCCCGYDRYYRDDYRFLPVSAPRTLAKRSLDYTRTNTDLLHTRAIVGSRYVETRNRELAQKLDRSDLQRRSVDRNLVSGAVRRNERSATRTREMERRVIYGGERTTGAAERAMDRRIQTGETRRARETSGAQTPRTHRRINTRRDPVRKEEPARERNGDSERTMERRGEPQRRSGDSDRKETTRERSSKSSTRERSSDSSTRNGSKSPDRRSSSVSRESAYGSHGRTAIRSSSASSAGTRAANTTSAKRARSR